MTDDDEPRIALATFAPREQWLSSIGELARAAAVARAADDGGAMWRPARWFVPVAAGLAALAWSLPTPQPAPRSAAAVVLGGADAATILRLRLEGGR